MFDMNRIKVGVSGMTNTIYLYRMGKDPNVCLDKREADSGVFAAVIEYMLFQQLDNPKAKASQTMKYSDRCFRVMVERISIEDFKSERKGDVPRLEE